MILKGDLQPFGQGDGETPFNDLVGEQHPMEGLGIEVWLDDLEAKENAYLAAKNGWLAELSARQVGAVQQARRSADAAYRNLVEGVNLLATLHGDASFAGFIAQLNVMVAEEKEVLKGRATRRENKETQEEA